MALPVFAVPHGPALLITLACLLANESTTMPLYFISPRATTLAPLYLAHMPPMSAHPMLPAPVLAHAALLFTALLHVPN